MNIKQEKAKMKILAWSIEDSIDLFFFSSIVEEYYSLKDLALLKEATLQLIKEMLEQELIKAGDLSAENIFVVWKKSIDIILDEIKYKWNVLGRKLYPQELVWFEITKKGRKEFEYLNSLPELKETNSFYFDKKQS